MSTHYDTRSSLGWTISYIYYVVLDKTVRIFAYSSTREQSKAENRERDWGQSVFSLSPHMPYGRVRLARFARIRLLRHALPISLLILRKKPTVLQSNVV